MLAIVIPVLLLLLAVNALYVAAEFAAVSVRKSRIRQLASNGQVLARWMQPVVEDRALLDRYIAYPVGITISSLVLGAFGQATLTPYIAPAFETLGGMREAAAMSVSAIAVLLGLTALQVVLAELVPKSIALQYPTQVSLYTVLPMRWSLSLLRWFIVVLNGSALAFLRLVGASETSHGHIHSPGEIELLISQSAEGGELSNDDRRRLRRALHLGSRSAHEVMVPRPRISALNVHTSMQDAIETAAAAPFTRLPVYDDTIDNIVGVLHTKDLVLNSLDPDGATTLASLLRPVPTLPESVTVERLLSVLREQQRWPSSPTSTAASPAS
ncbi:MAG: hemolysin family protein [Dehalococcoidia bacterium]|nr:hemolysin family protein [Dehalococcoidia bacterium]